MSAPERVRVALLRTAYRVAYRLLSAYSLVLHPHTHGVKCVLAHGDAVVLVRHTYGPRRVWQLPGGGLHRRESPLAAASREMHEELGIAGAHFHPLAEIELELAHRLVTISCLHTELPDTALDPDPVEIAEARFFAHDALPAVLAEEVRELVDLGFAASAARQRTTVGE